MKFTPNSIIRHQGFLAPKVFYIIDGLVKEYVHGSLVRFAGPGQYLITGNSDNALSTAICLTHTDSGYLTTSMNPQYWTSMHSLWNKWNIMGMSPQ